MQNLMLQNMQKENVETMWKIWRKCGKFGENNMGIDISVGDSGSEGYVSEKLGSYFFFCYIMFP